MQFFHILLISLDLRLRDSFRQTTSRTVGNALVVFSTVLRRRENRIGFVTPQTKMTSKTKLPLDIGYRRTQEDKNGIMGERITFDSCKVVLRRERKVYNKIHLRKYCRNWKFEGINNHSDHDR